MNKFKTGRQSNTCLPKINFGFYLTQAYLRNRYYDPSIGRFTTEDPVKDGDNWYAYCGNNPVNRIDPNGCTDGQITGECGYGGIYDTSAYVNDKYKNGWVSSN